MLPGPVFPHQKLQKSSNHVWSGWSHSHLLPELQRNSSQSPQFWSKTGKQFHRVYVYPGVCSTPDLLEDIYCHRKKKTNVSLSHVSILRPRPVLPAKPRILTWKGPRLGPKRSLCSIPWNTSGHFPGAKSPGESWSKISESTVNLEVIPCDDDSVYLSRFK